MPLSSNQKILLFNAFQYWCAQNNILPEQQDNVLFSVLLQTRVVQLATMRVWLSTARGQAVITQTNFTNNLSAIQAGQAQAITDIDAADTVVQTGNI